MPPLSFYNPKNEPIDLQTKKPLFVDSGVQTSTNTYLPKEEKTSTASYFPSSLSESARKFVGGGFKGLFSKEPAPTWTEAGKQFVKSAEEANRMKGTVMVDGQPREINAFNPIAILSGEPLKNITNQKLTTKFLDYAQQKLTKDPNATLSRQEIMDFAKRPELKKGEADLLLRKLEEFAVGINQPSAAKTIYLSEATPRGMTGTGLEMISNKLDPISKNKLYDILHKDYGGETWSGKFEAGDKKLVQELLKTTGDSGALVQGDRPFGSLSDGFYTYIPNTGKETKINFPAKFNETVSGNRFLHGAPIAKTEIKAGSDYEDFGTGVYVARDLFSSLRYGDNIHLIDYPIKNPFKIVSEFNQPMEKGEFMIKAINRLKEEVANSDLSPKEKMEYTKKLSQKVKKINDYTEISANRYISEVAKRLGYDSIIRNKEENILLYPERIKIINNNAYSANPIIKKIRNLVGEFEQSKIPAQNFADSIHRDLLELKPVKVKEPQYKGITIDKNAPRAVNTVADEIARGATPEEAIARWQSGLSKGIKGKNYEEVVFESPIATNGSSHYPNSKKYFAHARGDEVVEGGKRVWREQEIQSDLLQKDNLERQYDFQFGEGTLRASSPEHIEIAGQKFGEKAKLASQKRFEEVEKLQPFTNDRFGERIMRERIKEKAQKGYNKYRLPTGETIGKIEGFEGNQWNEVRPGRYGTAADLTHRLETSDLKVGKEIQRFGEADTGNWIITDILGDGRFKAVQKDSIQRLLREARNIIDLPRNEFEKLVNYSETFDLTDKSNPQYRRYQDWGKFLKNKFGGKEVVDPQGNSWMEIDLKKEMGKEAIPAFGKAQLKTIIGGAIGAGAVVAGKQLFTDPGTTFEYQAKPEDKTHNTIPKVVKEMKDFHGTYYELDSGTTVRPVSEKYKGAIEQAYNSAPTINKGVVEAVLMKESSMGTNAKNKNLAIGKYAYLVGFTRDAKQELIRNGIVPDLDTPAGAIKAAAQFWDLRDDKYENATSTYNHHYSSGKLTPEQLKEFEDMVKYYGSQ